MKRHFFVVLVNLSVLAICLLVGSCAKPGSLSGGVKDEQAPQLIIDKSTPSGQTNFDGREVHFAFDEWVKLDNATSEIFITPPLTHRPKYSLSGKKLTIEFHEDEVLQPNRTYAINLGKGVKDITEGNAFSQSEFVFSTGNVIDSLSIKGRISDILPDISDKKTHRVLFFDLADSVVLKRPNYAANVGEDGSFQLKHLKAGSYILVGLEDLNGDYEINDKEAIGFIQDTINLPDSNGQSFDIKLTKNVGTEITDIVENYKDLLVVKFSNPTRRAQVLNADSSIISYHYKNDLYVWQQNSLDSTIFVSYDNIIDTIPFNGKAKDSLVLEYQLASSNTYYVRDSLSIEFNQPITLLDTSYIQLLKDSLALPDVDISLDTSRRKLSIRYAFESDSTYQLAIRENALMGLSGVRNDNITLSKSFKAREEFGKIIVKKPQDLNYDKVAIWLRKDRKVVRKALFGEDTESIVFDLLVPGKYELLCFYDKNDNERWDAADIWQHEQAESVWLKKLDNLKANWDMEVILDLDEFKR